jgi:CBS-domain-containing membrane protein
MTTEVVTVGADATVAEAARLMDRNAVKRLPVVSEDGVLVGIVSRSDLLRPFTRPDGSPTGRWSNRSLRAS